MTAPNISLPIFSREVAKSCSRTSILSGLARVRITAEICGCKFLSITNTAASSPDQTRRAKVIASAAEVASSNIDALEIGSPVKSEMTV